VQTASGQEESDDRVVWQFEAGDDVRSSPTVVDGTVYFGSSDGHVYALDAGTGDEIWRFDTDGSVISSPNVIDGVVYIGSGTAGAGHLHALDAGDGSEQWNFEADGWVHSSPTVIDGTVYFGSVDEHVYAVDASNGSEQWRFEVDDWVHIVGVAVVDDTVYVGSDDDHLYALDTSDGTERWRFDTGGNVTTAPTVVDGRVFIERYMLDAETGEELSSSTGSDLVSPTIWNDAAYGPGTFSGQVEEFSLDDSSADDPLGQDPTDDLLDAEDLVTAPPTIVDEVLFACDEDGIVYAADLTDRDPLDGAEELWRFDTGRWIESSPIVVDGILYVGNRDGQFYALETGIEGSSEDSHVKQGTLGHHHEWAGTAPQEITPGEPASAYDPQGSAAGDDSDGFGPGFSFGSAVVGGGLAYLLKHRNDNKHNGR